MGSVRWSTVQLSIGESSPSTAEKASAYRSQDEANQDFRMQGDAPLNACTFSGWIHVETPRVGRVVL